MDQFSSHPLYRRHNIDSAMNSLWEFYKKKFLALFIMSLVMSLVMQYASSLVNMKELSSITDPMVIIRKDQGFSSPAFNNLSDKSSLYNYPSVLCNIQPD